MGESRGTGGPDPHGKSQVIWLSIGNQHLYPPSPPPPPPPPGKSWTSPLGKCWIPMEPWKTIVFFEINHLTSVKGHIQCDTTTVIWRWKNVTRTSTVNLEIFVRISFSRIALKDIFATLKMMTLAWLWHDLPPSVKDYEFLPFRQVFARK